MPILVGVALSACNDEGDAIEGVGGSGAKAGSTGSGGDDAKAGSSNNGGKAGSETNTDGGTEDPGNGGTTNNAGTSSGGSGNEAGEGGDAGMAGMGGDGGGGEPPIVNGGTGGSSAGTGGTGGSSAGTGGTGGSSAGTGGSSAGTGGSSAGTGGSSAGTGGTDAGGGGSGGTSSCPTTPVVLYDFATNVTGWEGSVVTSGFGASNGTATLAHTAAEGHVAANGALQNTVVFTSTGVNSQTYITLNPQVDWSCYTKLHMWIKLVAADPADYGALASIQTYLNPGTGYDFKGGGGYVNNFDSLHGTWHEYVLTLPPEKNDVGRIGILFQASGAANIAMYIDDITLD